jgi:hypothetical protein
MLYEPYSVAMSHLSDAQELVARGHSALANRSINFAKWIIGKYKDEFNEPFNPNEAWNEFVDAGF